MQVLTRRKAKTPYYRGEQVQVTRHHNGADTFWLTVEFDDGVKWDVPHYVIDWRSE